MKLQAVPGELRDRLQHCVKSVRIRSYSDPYFPTFGLNTDRKLPFLQKSSENHRKLKLDMKV